MLRVLDAVAEHLHNLLEGMLGIELLLVKI
jgi:hypothetical protein